MFEPIRRVFVLTCALACLSVHAAWARSANEDVWVSVLLKGQKVGYAHYTVTHPKAGETRRYSVNYFKSHLLGQEISIDSTAETWVDAKGVVLSGHYVIHSSGRTATVDLVAKNGHYIATSGAEQHEIDLPAGQVLLDDPSFELFMGERLGLKDFFVFDPQNQSFIENKVSEAPTASTADAPGAATAVVVDDVRSPTTFLLDKNRQTVEALGPFGLSMKITSEQEAQVQGAAEGDLADASLITVDNPPDTLEGKTEATWYFTGNKVTMKGDSQKSATDENGQTLVVHQFRNPNRSVLISDVKSPSPQWLEPEFRVESDSPDMVDAARKMAGTEKRLWAATQLIRQAVHRAIAVNAGIGVLRNATEVWQTKEGVCRDHAVLMLTLLRAVHIPTRMVCGLVYESGALYYHAWVEVFDGEHWIGVDSTRDDEFLTAGHIGTAEGTAAQASTGFLLPGAKVQFVSAKG